jgi:hypothetical protein
MERRRFGREFKIEAVRLVMEAREPWCARERAAEVSEEVCCRSSACIPREGQDEARAA